MKRTLGLVLAAALLTLPATAAAAPVFKRVFTEPIGPSSNFGLARTGDGVLHLMFQTHPTPTAAPNGLAAIAISQKGAVGSVVQALSGWTPGKVGLTAPPTGTSLAAFFGAVSPDNISSVWGILSQDDGATWGAPT